MRLVKIPNSQGCLGKNLGCEEAPEKVIEFVRHFYINEDKRIFEFNIEHVNIVRDNLELTNENISKVKFNNFPIFLGGDHSITYPLFKKFAEEFENPGIVIFDAHPDCVNNFKPPTHEDFLRVLVEDRILKKENIIIVGLRNWSKGELDFLEQNKIKFFTMKQIFGNLYNLCDSVMELARGFDNLYLSLDIDVTDPAFAPGTGYPVAGGFSSRELIYFLQRMKLLKNLRAMDLVEVNPKKDINNITINLAAKILVEMNR